MNILEEANKIVNTKTERSVLYGSYRECNQRIADIMSILTNKEITVTDVFYLEVAMKFAREIQCHKEENLLDIVAYIGALNNELNNN
jgi:hypothetical protein